MIIYEINFVCDGEELLGERFPGKIHAELGKSCHGVWCYGISDRHDDTDAWNHARSFGWLAYRNPSKLKGIQHLCPVCVEAKKHV